MIYTEKDRKNDFHWFLNNYKYLYEQHGHKFLAIQYKTIIGVYDGMREALDKTAQRYPLGTFSVQECNGNESAYLVSIVTVDFVK